MKNDFPMHPGNIGYIHESDCHVIKDRVSKICQLHNLSGAVKIFCVKDRPGFHLHIEFDQMPRQVVEKLGRKEIASWKAAQYVFPFIPGVSNKDMLVTLEGYMKKDSDLPLEEKRLDALVSAYDFHLAPGGTVH